MSPDLFWRLMMKVYNVLVFPGGTELGLEIHKALCYCKNVNLFSAGLNISNHAPFVFSNFFSIPIIDDPSWINRLNEIIVENEIDYVFPAYDNIIVALAQNKEKVRAKIIIPPLETCLITRSKLETYRFLENVIPVPIIYNDKENIKQFPVFVKPEKGQGSEGTHVVYNRDSLMQIMNTAENSIILEYLPGKEYTIDCFSDRSAGLLFCNGRERIRTRSGISMGSQLVQNDLFFTYAKAILNKMTLYGAWFFQLKEDCNGIYKLLEVAPRIAGTSALNRVLGINFPLLSIYEQERIPIEIMSNKVDVRIDRALINRFIHDIRYSVVYIDLDDTLIVRGKLNLVIMRFLYQCLNNHVRIILITKHSFNIDTTLRTYRLENLFDNIIKIDMSDKKVNYINEKDAIFIDDSFTERKEVHERHGIPTFDCSMLEMLNDERM